MQIKALTGCLLALSAAMAHCGTMGPQVNSSPKIYAGAFGGGGSLVGTHINQSGTAFYTEAEGGPLAVNAFGTSNSAAMGMVGGHVGLAWSESIGRYLSITPAVELEGYYMGGATIEGNDVNNNTVRLPEHNFLVKYPLSTGVVLVNGVLNANHSLLGMFRPYLGVGVGTAVVSIHNASSTQLSPVEAGVNHYNSNTGDTALAFAAQPKVGIRYDVNPQVNVFAEYRFLYLSQTNYTFGSTVVPGHVETSPWLVSINSQYYNMGTIGVDFDL